MILFYSMEQEGAQLLAKKYDFAERSHVFAKNVRVFLQKLPRTVANAEDGKQLIRSSGSVGANYIEADNALSKKDRILHFKISRKEARECIHWLHLLDTGNNSELEKERLRLMQEAKELMLILSSIIQKYE